MELKYAGGGCWTVISVFRLFEFMGNSSLLVKEPSMKVHTYFSVVLMLLFLQLCSVLTFSQTSPPQNAANKGALRGTVTDPSGAAMANADVILTPPSVSASPVTTKTNGQGAYEFNALAPGQYSLTVTAPGFSVYENDKVVMADQPLRLNVSMAIEVEQEKI